MLSLGEKEEVTAVKARYFPPVSSLIAEDFVTQQEKAG